jgi:tryptophan synthase alpha chain
VTNPIDAVFQRLRSRGRKAFIPFLTGGDPDLAATTRLARALAGTGANILEIGFPYSDPIADGPVIQASYTRVLDRGLRLDDLFRTVGGLAAAPEFAGESESRRDRPGGAPVPRVAMVSYSLIHRRGAAAFLDQAQAAGISGAIVPDLPMEESAGLERLAAERDFKLIQLVTPTTPRDRARAIAGRSTGFLYCVSVTGITGERDRLPAELLDQLGWLRQQTDLPLCVGFGISRPEHVHMLREVADGVIVGSAIVRHLEQAGKRPLETIIKEITDLAKSLCQALNPVP